MRSHGPGQKYLKKLRENPDPELLHFVQYEVPRGVPLAIPELWKNFNGRRGYYGNARVFKYALEHAGMESDALRRMTKP